MEGGNNGFPYAFESPGAGPGGVIGEVERIDFDWKPGFKVGLGWRTFCDGWDVQSRWTYYRNHSSTTSSADALESTDYVRGLFGFWSLLGLGGGIYGSAKASWDFNHNIIDFEWGKDFYENRVLTLRTHFGLRGGWLYQKFNARYSDNAVTTADAVIETIFSGKNRYYGIGARTGLDGNWHLGCGFDIFGNVAAALLYGKTKASQKERVNIASNPGVFFEGMDVSDKFYQLAPNLQLLIGLSWETWFHCDQMRAKLSLGWETNYWWDQFHIATIQAFAPAAVDHSYNQPILLQGLTASGRWDF